jgi:hypothetical protein
MKIMQEMHDAPMVGHLGEKTIRATLNKSFYWPNMKENMEHYVCTCVKCQKLNQCTRNVLGYIGPFQWNLNGIHGMPPIMARKRCHLGGN